MFLGGHVRIESQDGHGTIVRAVFPKDLLVPHESVIVAKRRSA